MRQRDKEGKMEVDIDIYGWGRRGKIFIALDALILVYLVIFYPILLLALDTLILLYMFLIFFDCLHNMH